VPVFRNVEGLFFRTMRINCREVDHRYTASSIPSSAAAVGPR
jgi:hypothetical protein